MVLKNKQKKAKGILSVTIHSKKPDTTHGNIKIKQYCKVS